VPRFFLSGGADVGAPGLAVFQTWVWERLFEAHFASAQTPDLKVDSAVSYYLDPGLENRETWGTQKWDGPNRNSQIRRSRIIRMTHSPE